MDREHHRAHLGIATTGMIIGVLLDASNLLWFFFVLLFLAWAFVVDTAPARTETR